MNPLTALFAPLVFNATMPTVPGAINPDITQANISQTVCVPGYSATIRPPGFFTSNLKRNQIAKLGLTGGMADYEEDHLIPLSIGGAPQDANNLWPEPWKGPWNAHTKDRLELKLHTMVCKGQISLVAAQQAVASNWITAYQQYVTTTAHRHKHRKKSWRSKYF